MQVRALDGWKALSIWPHSAFLLPSSLPPSTQSASSRLLNLSAGMYMRTILQGYAISPLPPLLLGLISFALMISVEQRVRQLPHTLVQAQTGKAANIDRYLTLEENRSRSSEVRFRYPDATDTTAAAIRIQAYSPPSRTRSDARRQCILSQGNPHPRVTNSGPRLAQLTVYPPLGRHNHQPHPG